MKTENWKLPEYFNENYHRLSIELLNDISNEAEKYLQETVSTAESITSKTQWAIAFLFSIASGIVGVLFTNSTIDFATIVSLSATMVVLIISFIFLNYAFKQYRIVTIGSVPSQNFDSSFFEDLEDDYDNQERIFILQKCVNYEAGININRETNSKRSINLIMGLKILILSPLFFTISFLVVNFFS